MTRNDLLRMLLAAADDVDRSFDRADSAVWPPGSLDELQRLGILRRSAGGMYATCPNCDEGHIEPVTVVDERFYISCPESMLVEVEPEMCERWEIDPAGEVLLQRLQQTASCVWPSLRSTPTAATRFAETQALARILA